ncbi:MAG TPA: aminoacyl--tRNA ligase-related protein [Candidatus Paceibacterota bacterium]|nr:aminoacyl--tRNA ligase-related protein [Candidatus Paceibacterota bacterium]
MRQSELFTKTRREGPKDEVAKNAELLIRAGYIHKEMAGVYSFLPLGLRVREKIEQIIREEMNAIGGQELSLTALQDKTLWEKSGRWSDEVIDNWFKTKLKNESEVGLAVTHEEPLTNIVKGFVKSYRDLPVYAYQFQTKFRNELRAKSGILRGREFLMKDLYSFSRTEEEHQDFYKKTEEAYRKIFERAGIGDKTYFTFASGGIFSKYSHEFQTLCDSGEDTIYVDEKKGLAINKEVYDDEGLKMAGLKKADLKEKKAIEVGNIFSLGTRYSEALDLKFVDEKGKEKPVIMGSYGIGVGRLLGTIVEVLGDEKGIVWPESVAPFKVHLIHLAGSDKTKEKADEIYQGLMSAKMEVLYDDRDLRAGEKFQDSDLIGLPYRVIVSDKTLESGRLEMKVRASGETKMIGEDELKSL